MPVGLLIQGARLILNCRRGCSEVRVPFRVPAPIRGARSVPDRSCETVVRGLHWSARKFKVRDPY